MKRNRKVLLFIICSIFLVVVLSGLFLSWLGAQVDCHTGDEEPVEALCTCPFVKVSLQPYADFTQKEALQLKRDLEKRNAVKEFTITFNLYTRV